MKNDYQLVLCIVNSGFSEEVMSAARECGATGGTIINARGTVREEALEKFDFEITPEKEIVLILVKNDIKEDVLHNLYQKVGLNSPGSGIAFALPVDEVVGMSTKKNEITKNKEEK